MEDQELLNLFIEEFKDMVEKLKLISPKLKNTLNNKKLLSDCHLIFHNIKGCSGMVGLQNLYKFSLDLESIINANKPFNDEILDLLRESVENLEKYSLNLKITNFTDISKLILNQLEHHISQINI